MPTFKFFCFTCKKHVEFAGDSEKTALQEFHAHGHDDTKRKTLRKGLVGN